MVYRLIIFTIRREAKKHFRALDGKESKTFIWGYIGSVSIKFAIVNEEMELLYSTWERTQGSPIQSLQKGFVSLQKNFREDIPAIKAVGTTGSARYLVKSLIGADIAKTEILSHAIAASHYMPEVRTILEIGGQDSKLILMREGIITDFTMNSICAAGTGSFLDHQAHRLGTIEEFGGICRLVQTV